MGTRSNIAYEKPNGKVVVMYCHYDGYPEYNGRILNDHYNNRSKAHALVDGGYQSALKETLEDSTKDRVHQDKADIYHSAHAFLMNVQSDIEWIYLFKNNEWHVAECCDLSLPVNSNDFVPLWSCLCKLGVTANGN
tara:strand:- start:388 stop:795 length:408 start_codon:yes stop_codon:yes gene_type:complete